MELLQELRRRATRIEHSLNEGIAAVRQSIHNYDNSPALRSTFRAGLLAILGRGMIGSSGLLFCGLFIEAAIKGFMKPLDQPRPDMTTTEIALLIACVALFVGGVYINKKAQDIHEETLRLAAQEQGEELQPLNAPQHPNG